MVSQNRRFQNKRIDQLKELLNPTLEKSSPLPREKGFSAFRSFMKFKQETSKVLPVNYNYQSQPRISSMLEEDSYALSSITPTNKLPAVGNTPVKNFHHLNKDSAEKEPPSQRMKRHGQKIERIWKEKMGQKGKA